MENSYFWLEKKFQKFLVSIFATGRQQRFVLFWFASLTWLFVMKIKRE